MVHIRLALRTLFKTLVTNEVGPGYLRTLGIPLIAGREFTRADAAGTPKVAIVNEAFAKKPRTPSHSGRARSDCAGRRARRPSACAAWCSARSAS